MQPKGEVWSTNLIPAKLAAGTKFTVNLTIRNSGDTGAWFQGWYVDSNVDMVGTSPSPYYHWLEAGQQGLFTLDFTMPNFDVQFYLVAWRWNGSQWVEDDKEGPYPIIAEGASGTPKAKIWSTSLIPAKARAGDVITIFVSVKNEGPVSGLLQPWVQEANVGFEGVLPQPFWLDVAPNATGDFSLRFTMPDHTVNFWLVAAHWDVDEGWVVDERHDYYTIATEISEQVKSLEVAYAKV